MAPELREGAARLSWETGAPLVPATITGAYRAWPYFQRLPKPAHIRVRFHDPIEPSPYQGLPEDQALPAMLAELRRRVDRSLLPGVKADLRIQVLYASPAPWPRFHESIPPLLLALLVFWKTRSFMAVLPAYVYLAYLLLDRLAIPQSRFIKRLRNASPVVFLLAYGPIALGALGFPDVPADLALAAILAGAAFPYLYERGRTALAFIRGLVLASVLELLALWLAPTGLGPHVALPVYAAAFAWARRTVFSGYAAPVLVAYSACIASLLRGGLELAPHAIAGLLAWLLTALAPVARSAPAPDPPLTGLGLDR
jgi:hypothetical protein